MAGERENIGALNSVLFQQLERLTNDDLEGDALDAEIKRSKAVTHVADTIIQNSELALKAAKYMYDCTGNAAPFVPKMLGSNE